MGYGQAAFCPLAYPLCRPPQPTPLPPFRSCIAYLIIVGDSFRPLLLQAFGDAWWTSRAATITGISCAVILPLSFKTRLGALKGVCQPWPFSAG